MLFTLSKSGVKKKKKKERKKEKDFTNIKGIFETRCVKMPKDKASRRAE